MTHKTETVGPVLLCRAPVPAIIITTTTCRPGGQLEIAHAAACLHLQYSSVLRGHAPVACSIHLQEQQR
jgi:hypothetical protein